MGSRAAIASIALFYSLALLARTGAATVDVTQFGAVPNDQTDDAHGIQRAINESTAGDTIFFPPGTYLLSSGLVFRSDRKYVGKDAVLKRNDLGDFTAHTENDHGANIVIDGLTFDTAGFAFTGSGKIKARNIRIENCSFTNITQKKYPYDTAIYIPIGASECEFSGNIFRNIRGDMGIASWNLDHTSITDNQFENVNEGMHLNGVTTDCQILRNSGVHIHRMGIEIQGKDNANLVVEDNHFANWVDPFHDSFGLSIVPSSGPNISVRYNTVLARPPMPGKWTERFGFGLEIGGDVLCRDNFSEGYWWNGIVIGGKRATVTHNLVRGPHSGEYTTPTKIVLEPGSDKDTETISDNTQVITAAYIENPTEFTIRQVASTAALSWAVPSNNHTGFKVERRIFPGDYAVMATLPGSAHSYSDDSVAAGKEYTYRIQAFNESGDITYSPSVRFMASKP
jgi:hypothetical protein